MKLSIRITPVLAVLCFYLALPPSATAQNTGQVDWQFEIEKGLEKSTRSYLLVHSPGQKDERRIKVKSVCEKPHHAEGAYGKCSHKIVVSPRKKEFVIDSGEDVILLYSQTQRLILSTLEYGCCGGPDTARFYAEDGKYLGSFEGFELRRTANYDNVITRTFDMRNATENYLIISDGEDKATFAALAFEKNNAPKKLPLLFTVSGMDDCDYWHVNEFQKYGDRDFLTLKLKGSFCHKEVLEEQEFKCTKTADGINCIPLKPVQ